MVDSRWDLLRRVQWKEELTPSTSVWHHLATQQPLGEVGSSNLHVVVFASSPEERKLFRKNIKQEKEGNVQETLKKHTRFIANATQYLSQLLKLENWIENSRLKNYSVKKTRKKLGFKGIKRNWEKRQWEVSAVTLELAYRLRAVGFQETGIGPLL